MEPKQAKQRQNRRSKAQEQKRAQQVGGRTQAGSGSSRRAPQDVVAPEYLEQVKYTDAASYRFRVLEWDALTQDAHRAGREPRMVIDFAQYALRIVVTEEPLPHVP